MNACARDTAPASSPRRSRNSPNASAACRSSPPQLSAAQRDAAVASCPFAALSGSGDQLQLDLGRCLFCADCPAAAQGALRFSSDYRLAARARDDLLVGDREYRLGR